MELVHYEILGHSIISMEKIRYVQFKVTRVVKCIKRVRKNLQLSNYIGKKNGIKDNYFSSSIFSY